MKRHILALAALALAAAPARAQAPRITEAGDPSIRADTIYRLAAKPEDYPEESSILLLDDGVVIINEDGTGSRTYRTIVQVLTQDAVEQWAENTFSWDGKRERFRLNWARVIGPDGRVISDKPSHDQESAAPVSEVAPVFIGPSNCTIASASAALSASGSAAKPCLASATSSGMIAWI